MGGLQGDWYGWTSRSLVQVGMGLVHHNCKYKLVWVDFKVIGMGGLQGHWYRWGWDWFIIIANIN